MPRLTGVGTVVAFGSQHEPFDAVVDVEELPCRRTVAPERDALRVVEHLPDQPGNDVRRFEVEVVTRSVEVRRQQEDRVEAVLLAIGLRADEDRLLGDAVGRVRLFGIAVPQVGLAERHGGELRIGADGAGDDELADAVFPRELEHVRSHHQVRVPEAARVEPVRADAAHLARKVEHPLGLCVAEEPLCLVPVRQVDLGATRDDDVVTVGLEARDEMRAEKAPAARHERLHAGARVCVCQSTRPIQRGRFSAYHAIVRATPSSHDTFGSQPVSRFSFS